MQARKTVQGKGKVDSTQFTCDCQVDYKLSGRINKRRDRPKSESEYRVRQREVVANIKKEAQNRKRLKEGGFNFEVREGWVKGIAGSVL